MRLVLGLALMAVVSGGAANAESAMEGKSETELIAICADKGLAMSDREPAALELTYRRNIKLSDTDRDAAIDCMSDIFKVTFVYNGFDLYSDELDTAAFKENSAKHDAKISALNEAINAACVAEYHIDRFRAVTTPVCQKIFLSEGLPESSN